MAGEWYLGPVGACRLIPAPIRALTVDRELVGATVRSLAGATTVYRYAQPRSWTLGWPTMTEDEGTYLRMVGLGLVPSLRLIDPMVSNLLPVQVATGGSYRRDSSRFGCTGGSYTSWVAMADPPVLTPLRGVQSWVRDTTAAGTLTLADISDRVPLVGRPVRFTAWVRGTAVTLSAAVNAYDAAGTATLSTGTSLVLDPAVWRYVEVNYVPAAGKMSLVPLLSIAAGQAASTVQTTGWMVAFTGEGGEWSEGGGAPEVVIATLGNTYAKWRRYALTMTLIERRM